MLGPLSKGSAKNENGGESNTLGPWAKQSTWMHFDGTKLFAVAADFFFFLQLYILSCIQAIHLNSRRNPKKNRRWDRPVVLLRSSALLGPYVFHISVGFFSIACV